DCNDIFHVSSFLDVCLALLMPSLKSLVIRPRLGAFIKQAVIRDGLLGGTWRRRSCGYEPLARV
ncbi:MAG: hypothetical protein ACO4A5_05885, partial [Candidatus Puniceispirillaceae bacterium]